jgi:hypothetical protein
MNPYIILVVSSLVFSCSLVTIYILLIIANNAYTENKNKQKKED